VLASRDVRRRPVYLKELGQFLVAERERHEWEQAQAADMAKRRGLKGLTRQILLRLENGQTKNPDPKALRAAASLYGVKYETLIGLVIAERYGIASDLSRHAGDQQQAPQGGADVPAEARIRELQDRVAAYEVIVRNVRALAGEIVAATGEESGTIGTATTRRRRRDRKAS
jgi:transcriptional regulator with XRE-family HTH domain